MKYRTRLLTAFLVTVVLTNALTLAAAYYVARRSLFKEIGNNALSIAATVATFVDGDEHKTIQNPGDEKIEAYRRIETTLRKARDANRRDDTYVKYLYTMKPKVGKPTAPAYGVDPEESPENHSSIDQVIMMREGYPLPNLAQMEVDGDDFSEDQYGRWLSANVPIKDHSGNVVAAVGVDLKDDFVQAKFQHLKLVSLAGFGVSIALGFGVALWYSARASRQMEAVNSAFASFAPKQLLDAVLAGKVPRVETDRRRITVLFSDIREFTRMSENMRPEEVVKILNEYFEKMVEVVFRNQGMVDKFIGDGLMAFFGAPDDDNFQEEHAVSAALEMQQELSKLCKKWNSEGRRSLEIGIGINSGNAIVGNIGSAQRLEYTAIGDTVNLAARLESATKDLKVDVLISEYTYEGLKGAPFGITKKGATSVRGRDDSVIVYAVPPISDAVPKPQSDAPS